MSVCPVCGKPIPRTKSFCSNECEQQQIELKKGKFEKNMPQSIKILKEDVSKILPLEFLDQWSKGEGSSRRKYNIDKVKQLLQSGISENQIATSLGLYFKRSTIEEYLRVAHELMELEKG